jgi:hypothetical protein
LDADQVLRKRQIWTFCQILGPRSGWGQTSTPIHTQATPAAQQPVLFELIEDHRPAGERDAAERYREPSLFTLLERNLSSAVRGVDGTSRASRGFSLSGSLKAKTFLIRKLAGPAEVRPVGGVRRSM